MRVTGWGYRDGVRSLEVMVESLSGGRGPERQKYIGISRTVTGHFFTTLSDVTDADKIVNPKHFDSDPADIRLTLDVLAEVLRSLNTV